MQKYKVYADGEYEGCAWSSSSERAILDVKNGLKREGKWEEWFYQGKVWTTTVDEDE